MGICTCSLANWFFLLAGCCIFSSLLTGGKLHLVCCCILSMTTILLACDIPNFENDWMIFNIIEEISINQADLDLFLKHQVKYFRSYHAWTFKEFKQIVSSYSISFFNLPQCENIYATNDSMVTTFCMSDTLCSFHPPANLILKFLLFPRL